MVTRLRIVIALLGILMLMLFSMDRESRGVDINNFPYILKTREGRAMTNT